MPMSENREYRNIETALCADVEKKEENSQQDFIVTGYATTFNTPYRLYEDENGVTYYEQVDARAFDNAQMDDVIFQYNHKDRVYARTRNNTLQLTPDEHGLHIRADLSSTEASRSMYQDIASGLVDRMSFGFTVAEDKYDPRTHTRTILRFKKIFDVSAVDFPANDTTSIGTSTRSLINGWIEQEAEEFRRRDEIEKQKETLRQRIKILAEI